MKELNLLIIGIFLLSFGCNTQPKSKEVFTTTIGLGTPYFMSPEILNGKVKEVTEKIYFAVEENGTYAKGQRLTEAARDTLNWSVQYIAQFDRDGNLLISSNMDELDHRFSSHEYEIADGRTVEDKYYYKDTLRIAINITYDKTEKSENYERIRMPADTLIDNIKVCYDSIGAFTSWEYFNPSNELKYKYEFTSSEGIITGVTGFNKDGKQTYSSISELNDHGFASHDIITNSAGEEMVMEFEYTYDDMGNWTSRLVKGPDVVMIEERTITYYGDEDTGSEE